MPAAVVIPISASGPRRFAGRSSRRSRSPGGRGRARRLAGRARRGTTRTLRATRTACSRRSSRPPSRPWWTDVPGRAPRRPMTGVATAPKSRVIMSGHCEAPSDTWSTRSIVGSNGVRGWRPRSTRPPGTQHRHQHLGVSLSFCGYLMATPADHRYRDNRQRRPSRLIGASSDVSAPHRGSNTSVYGPPVKPQVRRLPAWGFGVPATPNSCDVSDGISNAEITSPTRQRRTLASCRSIGRRGSGGGRYAGKGGGLGPPAGLRRALAIQLGYGFDGRPERRPSRGGRAASVSPS